MLARGAAPMSAETRPYGPPHQSVWQLHCRLDVSCTQTQPVSFPASDSCAHTPPQAAVHVPLSAMPAAHFGGSGTPASSGGR